MRRVRDRVIDPHDPERHEEWKELLVYSHIPEGFWDCTVEAITEPTVRAFAEGAVTNAPSWLGRGTGFYFHGPGNSGKTSLMCLLGMEAARRGDCVLYLAMRDLPAVMFREAGEESRHNRLKRCDVLLLDDLGSERFGLHTAAGAAMEHAVRDVTERGRSLIVTSNISWSDFPTQYAEVPLFVSSLQRKVYPQAIINSQWPTSPETPW